MIFLLVPAFTKRKYKIVFSIPILLIKKIFTNEDGSVGVLYLASNDIEHEAAYLYQIYQKRWRNEEYHKSIKENTSVAKSPKKRVNLG